MKKIISVIIIALTFLMISPVTVFAADSNGYFQFNENSKSINYYDSYGNIYKNSSVKIDGVEYIIKDGLLSKIDGKEQGFINTADNNQYYIDSARAFNSEEYQKIYTEIISENATDIINISGTEYCFKDGILFTGIREKKYYDRGIFDTSYTGYYENYYIVKGKLANGIYSKKLFEDGIFKSDTNGIHKVNGVNYNFKNGVVISDVFKIVKRKDGKLAFYKNGVFTKTNGAVNIGNNSYYLKKGIAQYGKIKVNEKYRYYAKSSGKMVKNKTFTVNKQLYSADKNGILSYAALIYIQQNTKENESIPYPSSELPRATIASGGCGVCSSLMIIRNTTTYSPSLVDWKNRMMRNGCRVVGGTDIKRTAKLMKKTYGLNYRKTKSVKDLKKHLQKGYMAICNVGINGYFSSGGHYIVAAGIDKNGNVIVLDPYMTPSKYYSTCKGVDRKKYFKYDSVTNEVTCSFSTMKKGARGEYYYLFTPTKNVALRKSTK